MSLKAVIRLRLYDLNFELVKYKKLVQATISFQTYLVGFYFDTNFCFVNVIIIQAGLVFISKSTSQFYIFVLLLTFSIFKSVYNKTFKINYLSNVFVLG